MAPLVIERGHGLVRDHAISIPRVGLESDRVAKDACNNCHDGLGDDDSGPVLTDQRLRDAYASWWPDGGALAPWMEAIGAARAGRKGAMPKLIAVASDESLPRVVRASAVRLLGRDAQAHAASILEFAKSDDSLLRRSALRGLAALEGEKPNAALKNALSDTSLAVRGAAARTALEGWRRVQADAELRRAVIEVLAEEASAVPDDDARWFRLAAARDIDGDLRGALSAYEHMLELDPLAHAVRRRVEQLRKSLKKAGDK